ncbi:hypothetical protein CPC08DRAFT_563294 [Agrocybe pediades]|nr:hypothetical protein CPC08DRAFT_563294 [Agrocybe pediades]
MGQKHHLLTKQTKESASSLLFLLSSFPPCVLRPSTFSLLSSTKSSLQPCGTCRPSGSSLSLFVWTRPGAVISAKSSISVSCEVRRILRIKNYQQRYPEWAEESSWVWSVLARLKGIELTALENRIRRRRHDRMCIFLHALR